VIAILIAALLATPRPPRGGPAPEAPAQQQPQLTDQQVQDRVRAYLGTIDRPISAEKWKALGPRVAPQLEAIIADNKEFPSTRAKAVDGLVAAAPDRAAALVGKLSRDEQQPVVVRVAAMQGADRVLSSKRTLTELRPVLRSAKSAGLRAEAADVISRKQGGCADVRDQVGREATEHKGAFQRAMKRCEE
jgi:hypothetical protein